MAFTYRETQIVKGMLERGDKQHDIASYFGVNGGRVAEVASGKCDYPNAQPWPQGKLPPPGPYVGAKTVFEIKIALQEAIELIETAGSHSDESVVAIEALKAAMTKI
ncbi:hypothetical protein OE747_06105 [Ruegeria sp. XHP0148]|uniref:GcrA cell cycle regulator n=2 Tax=Ruegeria aquimaris TaxID=2984333 RepID=A0ABT3AGU6_9RHOB|nr:hypothetical protein [Ruegeria sp. XHP0148]